MRIAVVGGGAMGEALIAGWVASGDAQVEVVEASEARAAQLRESHGVTTTDLANAATADVVVLAVKPYQVAGVLAELTPSLGSDTLIVSIAAGVTLDQLADGLPDGQPVVRVMPNTPALVGEGMAGVVPGPHASDDQRDTVVGLMEAVGRAVVVPESQLDALTALSGSGPAYLFMVAEALIEAGVHQGLPRPMATELVNQTFVGSAAMLADGGATATELRERVTSPGGTTAAALRSMEDDGVRAAFLAAVEACADRSREMARG